jgi:uncharacterized membrane protein YphA (DoxX/SURF4 family)
MHRLFSIFPRGTPGAGLLLLRIGVAGALFRFDIGSFATMKWTAEITSLLLAIAILFGVLTPVVAILGGLSLIEHSLTTIGGPTAHHEEDLISTVAWIIVTLALALVGPGAYSIDSRLLGRREIIIPRSAAQK